VAAPQTRRSRGSPTRPAHRATEGGHDDDEAATPYRRILNGADAIMFAQATRSVPPDGVTLVNIQVN
jgi:hypothetical protein